MRIVETDRDPTPFLKFAKGQHPREQAALWFNGNPYPWQLDLLNAVAVPGTKHCWSTCNESGKTSELIPTLGLSIMAAFPGATIISTAGAERQVKDQLFKYLDAKLSSHPGWSVSRDQLKVKAPSIRGLPSSEWHAYVPRDADTAEGYHSYWAEDDNGHLHYLPTFYIIDEAKSVKEGIFQAAHRIDPDFMLVISTPGEKEGAFYESIDPDNIDEQDPLWTSRRMISWLQCPHLHTPQKRANREALIKKFGPDNIFVRSMMDGKFSSAGGNYIFDDSQKVGHAMSGMIQAHNSNRCCAVDLSGGGDEQVLAFRVGNDVRELQIFHEKDTDRLAKTLLGIFKLHALSPAEVVMDNGGLGKPIIDNIEGMGFIGIRRYMNNAKAQDPLSFYDVGTEDHFALKNHIDGGMIRLPNDAKLRKQMRERKYLAKNEDANKLKLEPKDVARKKGKGSPDRLDAVVMACADMPRIDSNYISEGMKDYMDYQDSIRFENEMGGGWGGMECER